jgi:cytoskeletal protein RodZ
MESVGEQLRVAREEQNLSLAQVVERTKLKTDHVRALEDGNYDVFAAAVYVRGFTRSYAAMLKLDTQQVLSDLDEELARSPKFRDDPGLAAPAQGLLDLLMLQFSKVNWTITLMVTGAALVICLSILGFRAWQTRQAADPLAGLGPGLYQPLQKNDTGDTLPLSTPQPRP